MQIRPERREDDAAIRTLTIAAFESSPYGHRNEADIVETLRREDVLSLSLVAVENGDIIGHAAFSPVRITVAEGEWLGLGPISVAPERQGRGVGSALMREGLRRLEASGASGCVVLGDPAYYSRFGFESDPAIRCGSEASPYLQRLVLRGRAPGGEVRYHPAFDG